MPTASILKDVIMTPFREPTLCGNAYTSTQTERERETEVGEKKNPKEWWENVSFIAIKDNNSRQENCFNCFWGREQIGADGGDGWKWGWQWEEEWHFWMAELLVKGV